VLADAVPLYPLYALLFADTGLSAAEISALFALWSFMGVVAEVPSGALADRYGRRAAIVAAGILQAAGYLTWIALPGFPGFAAGFVLWGLGGAMASGAFEALLYDGLAAAGEADRYARVLGRVEAAGLAVQVPIAGAATALFAAGGYTLAGLVSVATSLGAAAVAATLPDVRPERSGGEEDEELGYLATLRAGVAEAAGSAPVRAAVLAVAAITAFDGLEEYFPLLAAEWGVPTEAIPVALVAIPLAGALGAALGGRAALIRPAGMILMLLAASGALAAAGLVAHPAGIVGVTVFYGLHRLAVVIADTRLQERIDGPARATVTSVAGLATDLAAMALYGAWAAGGLALVTALASLAAVTVPGRLGRARRGRGTVGAGGPATEEAR
jgi:MFS family permease